MTDAGPDYAEMREDAAMPHDAPNHYAATPEDAAVRDAVEGHSDA